MHLALVFALFFITCPVAAETVVAVTAVRSNTILTAAHLAVIPNKIAGGVSDPAELIGLETRVNLYPNRPVLRQDVGAPRVIHRNEIVNLTYAQAGLRISVEGRALGPAGLGEDVRVMNLSSRNTIVGVVEAPGEVSVGGGRP